MLLYAPPQADREIYKVVIRCRVQIMRCLYTKVLVRMSVFCVVYI